MLIELRTKSQVTIPKKIVDSFGLTTGDKFEVFEKDGAICFMPVVVYPKKYVDDLRTEVANLKRNVDSKQQKTFNNVNELFDALEK